MNKYFNNGPFIEALAEKTNGKTDKALIALLCIALVVSASAAAVMYSQRNKCQKELDRLRGQGGGEASPGA